MTLNRVNKHYCAMKLQYKHISKLKLKKIDTWKLLSMSSERECIQDFDRNTSMERSELMSILAVSGGTCGEKTKDIIVNEM